MKRILLILLVLLSGVPAWTQEHNILIGAGPFLKNENQRPDVIPGAVWRLSYGFDIRLGEELSVMPGAGFRAQMKELYQLAGIGGDSDAMLVGDAFCQARYHFAIGASKMVFGLGPQLSYFISSDTYLKTDPGDPINGKEKYRRWDVGLQPSLVFLLRNRWQWGIEASIGLRNMLRQYPECNVTGNVHLHSLMLILGRRF